MASSRPIPLIYHITRREAWETARRRGEYRAPSLEEEGFIHCSTAEQVEAVANTFYRGQRGLVLLMIDPARLTAEVRWEAPSPPAGAESTLEGVIPSRFPHVYGPINLDAVAKVFSFEPESDGRFVWPRHRPSREGE